MKRAFRLARRALAYELALWRSLYRWVLRRHTRLDAGVEAFGYAGAVTPLILAFIGLSAIEVPTVHLLLPWELAQRLALVAGAYGLLWMVGLLASVRVYPHTLGPDGLRIRYGISVDLTVPWDAVETVRTRHRSLESGRTVQVAAHGSATVASIAVTKQTTTEIVLRAPTELMLPKVGGVTLTELRVYVDDPRRYAARSRDLLASSRSRTAAGAADEPPSVPR